MATIDSVTVGSGLIRPVTVLADYENQANYLSIVQQQLADAAAPGADIFQVATAAYLELLNAGGTFDRLRSAVGTTGILAVNYEGTKPTYNAAVIGFTPPATPTDFWQIFGVSNVVRVTRVWISGYATAAATVETQLIKRTTANTGGTAATVTASQNDSSDSAPTAVVKTYSVLPTPGTSGGLVRAGSLNLGAPGAAGFLEWTFTERNEKGLVLRGTAQGLVLNWNAAAVPSGTKLAIGCSWTEES